MAKETILITKFKKKRRLWSLKKDCKKKLRRRQRRKGRRSRRLIL